MNSNDRAITLLVMVAHGTVHTYEMAVPIFVVGWLVEFETVGLGGLEIEVTTATVGAIVTLGYGLFGLGALPGGVLVDRLGSRTLIAASLAGMGGSYLLLGLAPGLVVVALALVVWGAAASVYHPAGLSLVSKGVRRRGTGFAYHGMAGNLGIALGPLIAATLLLFSDWRTVALVMALPAFLAAGYALRAEFDETAAVERRSAADGGSRAEPDADSLGELLAASRRLFTGGFALVFVVAVCSGLYYRGVLTFLPEMLRGLSGFEPVALAGLLPEPVGAALDVDPADGRTLHPEDYFYSGLLMVGVAGQYVGGKLTDRIRVEYGIAGGFGALAVLAAVFVPVSALGTAPLIGVGAALGLCLFLVQPMYQATIAEYTPPGSRGLSYGYTYLGVFGVGALGGTVAGVVLAYATTGALFATLGGIAALASGIGLYLARRERQ